MSHFENRKKLYDQIDETLRAKLSPQSFLIAEKALQLCLTLIRKNRNYGNSVFEPPILAPEVKPDTAIRVRMSDKIHRIRNLCTEIERAIAAKEAYDQLFESLQDSFLDLAGYAVLWAVNDDRENTAQTSIENPHVDCTVPASINVDWSGNTFHTSPSQKIPVGPCTYCGAVDHGRPDCPTLLRDIRNCEASIRSSILESGSEKIPICPNCNHRICPGEEHTPSQLGGGVCEIL